MSALQDSDADWPLVRRAQSGDVEAFGKLVDRHRRAVVRTAMAALGSASDADDVAQETFVTVHQKLPGFRGDATFRTWLLAITWRKALDRRKSVTRWVRRLASNVAEDAAPIVEQVAATGRSQEDAMLASELQAELKSLIATLPRKLRDALLLAGSGDYSYAEIAATLRIPIGTVKWRVSEARKVLKQKLAAKGLTDAG